MNRAENKEVETKAKTNRPRRELSLARKLLYSAVTTVFFFAALELALAFVGIRPVVDLEDPFVGFSEAVPLMMEIEASDGQTRMVTRPNKLVWFNRQWYEKEKPAGTKRVFCLGGSTTYGRPYFDRTSFCGWLRELLPQIDPETSWEVHNLGGISYASYRVANVMHEVAEHKPDLFIVYSAQNEFLEHRTYDNILNTSSTWRNLQEWCAQTRSYALLSRLKRQGEAEDSKPKSAEAQEQLGSEVDERLNHTIGPVDYFRDAEWEAKVLRHYEFNLQRMVKIADSAGAKILFVNPASNLKDQSPFKSLSSDNLSNKEAAGINVDLAAARELLQEGKFQESAKTLSEVLDQDRQNADAHFLMGRSQFGLRDFAAAEESFQHAIDEDICPLRATSEVEAILFKVAEQTRTPLINFKSLLQQQCKEAYGHRILGDEYFLDHVHPTIDAHRDLAIAICEQLMQTETLPKVDLSSQDFQDKLAESSRRVKGSLSLTEEGIAQRNLAKVLHWAGKFEESANRASEALELLINDAESRFVLADSLKNLGQIENACFQYQLLLEDYPEYMKAYLPFGDLLLQLERSEEALEFLELAKDFEPENAFLHFTLGSLFMYKQEWKSALVDFEEANRLFPGDEATLECIEECQKQLLK